MTPKLRWGAASDIGLVREVNEDSKLHEPPLFAVADGMGGHLAGDVASGLAIETLTTTGVKSAGTLPEAVREANRVIFQKASSDEKLSGMGTTIIALYAEDDSAHIVHVGDCRAYLLRNGELERLTQDHTVVERLVQEGRIEASDADRHPQRSYLERALGVEPQVEVDVKAMDTEPGDRFLLCSDGLFGMIGEDRILEILLSEEDPEKAAKRLCKEAVNAGGRDNVTVIIVDYAGNGKAVTGSPATGRRAPAGPSAAAGPPGSERSRASEPSGRRVLWAVVSLLVLAAAGIVAIVLVSRDSWYVGISENRVAIFQGFSRPVMGVDLSSRKTVSDVDPRLLPDVYRRRLTEGIPADSRSDAFSIVANLRLLARTGPPPSPASTPVPPAPPALHSPGSPPPAAAVGPIELAGGFS